MKTVKSLVNYFAPASAERPFKSVHKDLLYLYPVSEKNREQITSLIEHVTASLLSSDSQLRYFSDTNMQAIFLRLLKSQDFKSVNISLLKSASDLMNSDLSYEAKSNFHVESLIQAPFFEEIIAHPFDFDEETSEYFARLLKNIACKLPADLLLHFLLSRKFSLFSAASMFSFHSNILVKTESRMAIFKVLALKEPSVQEYLSSSCFLSRILNKLKLSVLAVQNAQESTDLHSLLADCVDVIYYAGDIHKLMPSLADGILDFLQDLIFPKLLELNQVALFILVHILKSFKVPRICHFTANKLLEIKHLLFEEFNKPDEHRISLVLMLVQCCLHVMNDSKEEILEEILRLSQREGLSNFTVSQCMALLKNLISEQHEVLNGILAQSLAKIESMTDCHNYEPMIRYFIKGWEQISSAVLVEHIPCGYKLITSSPSHIHGDHNAIFGFLVLMKLKLLMWPGVFSITFSKESPHIRTTKLLDYNLPTDQCSYTHLAGETTLEFESKLCGKISNNK